MSPKARRMAGILLVVFPTVVFGGFTLLDLPLHDPSYATNQLRQGLWRAGHAHAGVLLILSVVALRYVGDAHLPERLKQVLHPFGRYSPARRILSFRSSTRCDRAQSAHSSCLRWCHHSRVSITRPRRVIAQNKR